ncbi:uncharacterized protein Bfra_008394 [Botrytis fragariae]|uniref:2EXR domain-containing protein n=1 Tax=Botrytis fragariae TaxID=1964551 RepID=A0A8H6AT54_9HELO|nr:uncharacterized protein Bfra_008394 [Botrytis fragariae]KAF5873117.1 hypothetical protein Bfra_008394 [Botrytis fragariae]
MSNATIPTGLRVCKESRDETLRFYKLCFAADPSNARIYFNVDCDVPHLITQPLDPYFYNLHMSNHLFTPQNMGSPLATYPRLFSIAHAAIKNDIKAVCLEDCRLLAGEYEGPPMHLFGPNCQVFDFYGIYFRTQNLYYGELPQQSLCQRIGEMFGTSKFAYIDGHPPIFPIGWTSAPSHQPSDSFAPSLNKFGPRIVTDSMTLPGSLLNRRSTRLVRSTERLV